MVDGILQLFPNIQSVADFGCGTGVYVWEFRKRGVRAQGYEYSETAQNIAREKLGVEVIPFDLTNFDKAEGDFDVCTCIEVAEHLVPELGDRLVEICTQTCHVSSLLQLIQVKGGKDM